MKTFFSVFLVSGMLLLSGCTTNSPEDGIVEIYEGSPGDFNTNETSEIPLTTNPETLMADFEQTTLPEKGEQIVVMETSEGTIKIRLFPELAPKTVENFVGLAEKGYYDGIIFHRVIPNFMIQGGDPTGTGMGGESLWGDKFDNEVSMKLSNIRGALAMANAGLDAQGKGTNGSQFFINQVDNAYLNGYENGQLKDCSIPLVSCHSVFGQVFEGMEVVDEIANVEANRENKPLQDVVMEKVTVETY